MNDQDERFYFSSLLSLLSTSPQAEEAAQQIVQLLERLFGPARGEIWLAPVEAGYASRCIHPQGRFSRFSWSARPEVTELSAEEVRHWPPDCWRISLGPAGYLLWESSQGLDRQHLRHLTRCCQLAVGTLQTLLERDRSEQALSSLQARQLGLEAESNWLQNCLSLMQMGGELLDTQTVLERLRPLLLEAFPAEQLVLGQVSPEGWQIQSLQGAPWPPPGSWQNLWDNCFRYGKVIHFDELGGTRFAGGFAEGQSLTVAPLGFATGVLSRVGPPIQPQRPQSLRNFELGAQLLGYLLKISHLHGQVSSAYDALKESEIQRSNAVKLAAIGQIAAGVAHEINNPLASVKLTLDGLTRDRNLSETSQKNLKSAQLAVQRCQEVARELLSFSRESNKEYRFSVDLQEAGRRAVGISQQWAESRKLSLQADWEAEPMCTEANLGKLQEILLNLIENALWASDRPEGRREVRVLGRSTPTGLEIRVQDSGPGVQPELRERIFEPFFTTRPMGEATGLGLAIAARLAQGFGGEVKLLESGPDGSTFCLRLPPGKPTRPRSA
ncbi:HAMP domain-containing histidine kinase [bacterium]|nr:HAMP domain-containing histidine kinase [bacterium]